MIPRRRGQHQVPNDALRLISYCPLCEAAYNPLRARILDEREDAHLLHIQCASCGSSIVALVVSSALGITSVGLVTDLTGDDVLKFKDDRIMSADDVLEFHNFVSHQGSAAS